MPSKKALSQNLFLVVYCLLSPALASSKLTDFYLVNPEPYIDELPLTFDHPKAEMNEGTCNPRWPQDKTRLRACVSGLLKGVLEVNHRHILQGLVDENQEYILLPKENLRDPYWVVGQAIWTYGDVGIAILNPNRQPKKTWTLAEITENTKAYLALWDTFQENNRELPSTVIIEYIETNLKDSIEQGSIRVAPLVFEMIETYLRMGSDPYQHMIPTKMLAKISKGGTDESPGSVKGRAFKVGDSWTAYLKITDFFSASILSEYDAELSRLGKLSGNNFSNLIVDLRNNPGGELKNAVNISGRLLPPHSFVLKTVVDGVPTKLTTAENPFYNSKTKPNLIVLANEKTASAAEALVAILKLHANALVIGNTTFGKNEIQKVDTIPYLIGPEDMLRKLSTRGEFFVLARASDADKDVHERNLLTKVAEYSFKGTGIEPNILALPNGAPEESPNTFRAKNLILKFPFKGEALPQTEPTNLAAIKSCLATRQNPQVTELGDHGLILSLDSGLKTAFQTLSCLPSPQKSI